MREEKFILQIDDECRIIKVPYNYVIQTLTYRKGKDGTNIPVWKDSGYYNSLYRACIRLLERINPERDMELREFIKLFDTRSKAIEKVINDYVKVKNT